MARTGGRMIMRQRARVVRRTAITESLDVTVTDEAEEFFACALLPAARSVVAIGESPRTLPPGTLWHSRTQHAARPLRPGDRVEGLEGTVWELLGPTRQLRAGDKTRGYAAAVLPVAVLYPLEATIHAQGGDNPLVANVPMAMWSPRERQEDRGRYEDIEAEVPIEFLEDLEVQNRWMTVGARRFRVSSATPQHDGPRVTLTLSRTNG